MKQVVLGIIGAALGAFIPCASYQLSRHECASYPWMWVLVAGGFLFSSFTVFDWAKTAFGHSVKAFGFVILTEGVLVLCHTEWLSIGGLIILAALNATATASNLLRDRTEDISSETSGGILSLGLGGIPAGTPQETAVTAKRHRRGKKAAKWDRKLEATRLLDMGHSRQDVADKLGVDRRTIQRWSKAAGVTPITEIRPTSSIGSVM